MTTLRIAIVCLLVQKTSFRLPNVAFARINLDDPIFFYTTTELACSEGYSVQEHTVVTDDGYILKIHRIPNGRNRPKVPRNKHQYQALHQHHHPDFDECVNESLNQTSKGFPILFVHGLLMTSDSWLLQGPGYDLAYIMADSGYDVWLANVRGSFYTKSHVNLTASDPKFWDFSFHENAVSDIPTTIDYVLDVTKHEKLGYVALSMGTTVFFAMASIRPEYNDKIIGFGGLGPVAYIKRQYMNPKRKWLFLRLEKLAEELTRRGDVYEVFPRSPVQVAVGKYLCSSGSMFQDYCYDVLVVVMGDHSKLFSRDTLHRLLTHFPTGNSLKMFNHYVQILKSRDFKLFDYGTEKNMERYGSAVPPDYPLWKITTPVSLYYTTGDFFCDVRDVYDLMKLLGNVRDAVEYNEFNHVDFLWSFKAKDMVYPKVLAFFKNLTDQYYLGRRRKNSIRARENKRREVSSAHFLSGGKKNAKITV